MVRRARNMTMDSGAHLHKAPFDKASDTDTLCAQGHMGDMPLCKHVHNST